VIRTSKGLLDAITTIKASILKLPTDLIYKLHRVSRDGTDMNPNGETVERQLGKYIFSAIEF